MNIKPVSVAVKKSLIETLESLEESYDANFKECKNEIDRLYKEFGNSPLVVDCKDNRDYWRFEYAKINKIKRIIQKIPSCGDTPAYKVTEETADATVYEEIKGGDIPHPAAEAVAGAEQ